MKIGLDARTLTAPRPRGTGRNLLDAYRLVPALRPDWEFVFYHQRPVDQAASAPDAPWNHPNVQLRLIDIPGDRFDAWFQLRLPLAARSDRLDLLHLPANAAPRWCPVPCVVTIHDLAPLVVPDELPPRETRAFRRGILRAVAAATHIITPSQATRNTLHQDLGVHPDRMTVVPWAPDAGIVEGTREPLTAARRAALRSKYELGEHWLISFSGSARRKNARGVLDGFARVPAEQRRGVQVLLTGCEPADYRAALVATAERLGISSDCRILGFVPHADLPALIQGSSGLLIPSRCEGFGLPILDAFACGVPVLTSNTSSMPEVAGDAAVYCDPHAPCSIAAGITQLLDPNVAARLIPLGRERLSQFNWHRTAEAMCAVYEQSGASPPPSRTAEMLEGCPR